MNLVHLFSYDIQKELLLTKIFEIFKLISVSFKNLVYWV